MKGIVLGKKMVYDRDSRLKDSKIERLKKLEDSY